MRLLRATTRLLTLSRAAPRNAPSMSTLAAAPTIVLNDGSRHPQIGFGTYFRRAGRL